MIAKSLKKRFHEFPWNKFHTIGGTSEIAIYSSCIDSVSSEVSVRYLRWTGNFNVVDGAKGNSAASRNSDTPISHTCFLVCMHVRAHQCQVGPTGPRAVPRYHKWYTNYEACTASAEGQLISLEWLVHAECLPP